MLTAASAYSKNIIIPSLLFQSHRKWTLHARTDGDSLHVRVGIILARSREVEEEEDEAALQLTENEEEEGSTNSVPNAFALYACKHQSSWSNTSCTTNRDGYLTSIVPNTPDCVGRTRQTKFFGTEFYERARTSRKSSLREVTSGWIARNCKHDRFNHRRFQLMTEDRTFITHTRTIWWKNCLLYLHPVNIPCN